MLIISLRNAAALPLLNVRHFQFPVFNQRNVWEVTPLSPGWTGERWQSSHTNSLLLLIPCPWCPTQTFPINLSSCPVSQVYHYTDLVYPKLTSRCGIGKLSFQATSEFYAWTLVVASSVGREVRQCERERRMFTRMWLETNYHISAIKDHLIAYSSSKMKAGKVCITNLVTISIASGTAVKKTTRAPTHFALSCSMHLKSVLSN